MFRFQKQVYLDNNASTPVAKSVRKKMARVLKCDFGNPSSPYSIGRKSAAVIEEAREALASSVNAEPEELFFASSATEVNNQVLKSVAEYQKTGGRRNKILSTPIEHPSIMSTLEFLEGKGFQVEYIPVDQYGKVNVSDVESLIDDNTLILCCMLANNEIGVLQNVKEIAAAAKKKNVLVLSDCVQALGKVSVDVKDLGVDYATFSAHKIHGPKGVGAVYVKNGVPFDAMIHGGHQEAGFRAGTESVHNIAGFGEACKLVPSLLESSALMFERRSELINGLKNIKPDLILNTLEENSLSNTVSITFPTVNNAALMAVLDFNGISVSAGSACSSSGVSQSHVLQSIGLSVEEADSTIRFSLSGGTTSKQIQYVVRVVSDFLEGKIPEVRVLRPKSVDQEFLFNDDNYILDIRFWYERQILNSMPNSHEVPFIGFKKYLGNIPKEKNIVVVCMAGIDATALAYTLYDKGFKNVSVVLGGVSGWRMVQPALYKVLAGENGTKLEPE